MTYAQCPKQHKELMFEKLQKLDSEIKVTEIQFICSYLSEMLKVLISFSHQIVICKAEDKKQI